MTGLLSFLKILLMVDMPVQLRAITSAPIFFCICAFFAVAA